MAVNISTITIDATPEKIWNVLTLPEQVKLWQYGSRLETSWTAGDSIRFVTEWDGKVFEQWGTVLEFTPASRLRYSLFAPRPGLEDKPENYFEMEYRLTPSGDQTLLEIIQVDNRPGARQEEPQGEENPILKMLKEIAEGKG